MRNVLSSAIVYSTDAAIVANLPAPAPVIAPTETETTEKPVAESKPAKPAKAKAEKPATDKPAKTAKPKAEKPAEATQHDKLNRYNGPSPTFRMHDRKLSPIVLGRVVNNYTARDQAFCDALFDKYNTKPFKRLDADAGNISRAAGLGYLTHVSGGLDERGATFQLTAKFVRERKQKASATPNKR